MTMVSHIPANVLERYDEDYGCTLMVFFDPTRTAGIKLAAAAAHLSVTAFIQRAVEDAVRASPPIASPAIGTMSPAAARPANRSDD